MTRINKLILYNKIPILYILQCCVAGAATFRAAPEPELIFLLVGAGAGADPSRSEPESAPGPWQSGAGAAQKSGGSAILVDAKASQR